VVTRLIREIAATARTGETSATYPISGNDARTLAPALFRSRARPASMRPDTFTSE
jgi:hypothetical protein